MPRPIGDFERCIHQVHKPLHRSRTSGLMTADPAARLFLQEALEAHLLELDLLWEQRESQIFSPVWTLKELAHVEARADAHLDALVLAGAFARQLAGKALTSGESGASCAGAFVFLACDEADVVYRGLSEADAGTALGIRSALRHGMPRWNEETLRKIGTGGVPLVRACMADVLAFHRRVFPDVSDLIEGGDTDVQGIAFAALARAPSPLGDSTLDAGLQSPRAAVRRAALRAAALSGMPQLADRCRSLVAQATPAAAQALELLGCLSHPEDLRLLADKLSDPALALAAARGLGAAGSPSGVPVLLEALSLDLLAVEASAAFLRITGASRLPKRKVEPSTPNEIDRDFAPIEEAIEPDAARQLWKREQVRFDAQRRYQQGRIIPSSPDATFRVLPLALRRDIALGARGRGELAFVELELEARSVLQRG
jgi:uncharacterized protein (TIGR02270 family)